MSDGIACIYCGGETRAEVETSSDHHKTQLRRCLVCGMPFDASIKKDGKPCTVRGCPDRARCLLKYEAESCAVYRAIVMRKLPIHR